MTETMKSPQGVENVDYVVIADFDGIRRIITTLGEWNALCKATDDLRDKCANRMISPETFSELILDEAEQTSDKIEKLVIPQFEEKLDLFNEILAKRDQKELRRLKGLAILNRGKTDGY